MIAPFFLGTCSMKKHIVITAAFSLPSLLSGMGHDLVQTKKIIADTRKKTSEQMSLHDCYTIMENSKRILAADQYNYPYSLLASEYKKKAFEKIKKCITADDQKIEQTLPLVRELQQHLTETIDIAYWAKNEQLMIEIGFFKHQLDTCANDSNLNPIEKTDKTLAIHQELCKLYPCMDSDSDFLLHDTKKFQKRELSALRGHIMHCPTLEAATTLDKLQQLLTATELLLKTHDSDSKEYAEEELNITRLELKIRLQKLHENTKLTKTERYICEAPLREELRESYPEDSNEHAKHNARLLEIKYHIARKQRDNAQ